ncbi:AI-2E family transporter [Candidatus Gracilibacteria bacterium]|nr:AI-2E family transporter [Candidatus Gracilibacteria bacterium]
MNTFKKIYKLLLNKVLLKKILAYILLILIVFLLKDFTLVLFLTFLFSYLFFNFGNFLKTKFDEFIAKILRSKNQVKFFKKIVSLYAIIIFLYLIFVGTVFFALFDLLPKLTHELKELPKLVPALKEPILMITSKLEEIKNINSEIGGSINEIFSKQNMDIALQVLDKIKTFGTIFVKILISLILSYIFIVDRDELQKYLKQIKNSNFGFLYDEYKNIFGKITKTFGLVFKAQSMIALANGALTTIGLLIIGLIFGQTFPFLYTIAIIVFICGFIPVLGTFISSIPILLIGYTTYQDISIIFAVVSLIAFVHAIEAYYLNPKIVASYTKLPLSLTFLILILSEHFMGFAGLVIGISSFYLLLEILKDTDLIISKSRDKLKNIEMLEENTKNSLKKDIRLSRKIDE